MLRSWILIAFFVLPSLLFTTGWQATSEPTRLDDTGLKAMLTGMGYEVKELNATTFEIPITASDLNMRNSRRSWRRTSRSDHATSWSRRAGSK